MSQPTAPSPGKPRRSWLSFLLRGFLVLLGLGLLGSIATIVIFRYLAMTRLEQARAEADRLDPGWRLADIQAKRLVFKEEENGGLITSEALNQIPSRWDAALHGPLPGEEASQTPLTLHQRAHARKPNERLDEEYLTASARALSNAAPALHEARRLAEVPRGRPLMATGPAIQAHRDLANLLRVHAECQAHAGGIENALQSVRCMLNASGAIGDEPSSLAQLVRWSIDANAITTLERVAGLGNASSRDLELVQVILEMHLHEPQLLMALRGDRASSDQSRQVPQGAPNQITQVYWNATGFWEKVYGDLLNLETLCVEAAKLPVQQQLVECERLQNSLEMDPAPHSHGKVLVRLHMPTIIKIVAADHRRQAFQGTAVLALAAERYRLKHGKWPQELDDLKPVVKTIPVDPFGSGPLKMTRTPDGVIFYSVGYDGEDNGGKLDRAKPNAKGVDLGFQLWDAHKRRQVVRPDAPTPETPP